ncbi:hypothetical protein J2Y69_001559 [Microbacterium resistens]|uniref:Aminoglycoside phosphotransferase n=1 Tax=Microbacterium resistens TaxID=156977 RepID=A0ABU1SBH5_9MICO|nr:hypothetical protein [Microbacterium resistens]MDR6866960.1 hypothetical protein [Microbacterium resistens]
MTAASRTTGDGTPPPVVAALARACQRFGARPRGEPRIGWHGRSAGVQVVHGAEAPAWLRVVVARAELARGDWWNGNVEAEALDAVPRPRLLSWDEWSEGAVTARSELMELLPGSACAPTPELRVDPGLTDAWWTALEEALEALARHRTDRAVTTPESLSHRTHVLFGERYDLSEIPWTTSHGDLHWANLFGPEFALVDWEAWGVAPAGSDIAGLYLHSLLVPEVAETIRSRFAEVLDAPSGRLGIAYQATRMLARAMAGDYPELIDPIHESVRRHGPVRARKA